MPSLIGRYSALPADRARAERAGEDGEMTAKLKQAIYYAASVVPYLETVDGRTSGNYIVVPLMKW
jgi:hypothetical protein